MRNSRALATIAAAGLLDLLSGLAFSYCEHVSVWVGWYWAISTATTVGYGDVTPHTAAGRCVAVVAMLTIIPLFAATFSLITSGLAAVHVHAEGERMRDRIDHVIKHHPDIPDFEEKTQ